MSNIYFEYPLFLLLFPTALICLKYCKQREDLLLFPSLKFVQKSKKTISLLMILKVFIFLFLTITLASPYTIEKYKTINKKAISIVLAIDISGSMEKDFAYVKKILQDFIKSRKDDKIGVVFFGDSASISSPLTSDKNFLKLLLKNIKVGNLGMENTALNDAIISSLLLIKNAKTKTKLLILLTDGIEKGSHYTYREMKSELNKSDAKIISIGFGDNFDKQYLKSLNGEFINAKDKRKLKDIFEKIDRMYKSNIKIKDYSQKNLLYQIPLFFAFLTLLFYTYLVNKRSLL